MYAFDYKRAGNVAEAAKLFAAEDDAAYLAGGQTLIPTLKQRLRQPSAVIDLAALAELKGISATGDVVTIGAGMTHAEVAVSDVVKNHIPGLADLASMIGDPQVRNRGTLGGSVANNDPAADYPAALLALNATVHTSQRRLTAADFFTGMFETALQPGELVVKVDFPIPRRAAYAKFRNPASRYAVVGVMVADTQDGPRVAVTGAGPGVFRWTEAEAALAHNFSQAAIQNLVLPAGDLNSDLHATAEYRAHLITVMAGRALGSMT
jgi:carbon-monoxide dehydrogenase medium subunit